MALVTAREGNWVAGVSAGQTQTPSQLLNLQLHEAESGATSS